MSTRRNRQRNGPVKAFTYKSKEMHKDSVNGEHRAHMNVIEISNGKGKKTVVDISPSGRKKVTERRLSKKEVNAIRRREFIPDLFKGMLLGIRNGKPCVRVTLKNKNCRKN